MDMEYEGLLGIMVATGNNGYRAPVFALLIGHKDLNIDESEIGFDINTNGEPNIKITKPIEKTLEEILEGYVPRPHGSELSTLQDQLDNLHWLGYAYVLKHWSEDKVGKAPLLVISSPRFVDLDIWSEISTESVIREINSRTNFAGESNDC